MLRWFLGLPVHMRIAILIAPFLAIGGFGLADLWQRKDLPQTDDSQPALFQLALEGSCVISAAPCKLSYQKNQLELQSLAASSDDLLRWQISSPQRIRGIQMAIVQNGEEQHLAAIETKENTVWYVEFPKSIIQADSFDLRMAVAQTAKVLIAEFPVQR